MKAQMKTEPKERPIIFSGAMVRQILAGNKTQTRRVVNWENVAKQTGCTKGTLAYSDTFNSWAVFNGNGDADLCLLDCPYGKSDRLWVRETWAVEDCFDSWKPSELKPDIPVVYRANRPDDKSVKWRPSIFMPRWASRITLDIVGVRVERLLDLSNADALAEGILPMEGNCGFEWNLQTGEPTENPCCECCDRPVERFADLWDKINGKKHPWSSNPYVWVIQFRKIDA